MNKNIDAFLDMQVGGPVTAKVIRTGAVVLFFLAACQGPQPSRQETTGITPPPSAQPK